jgi:hypothetical protein
MREILASPRGATMASVLWWSVGSLGLALLTIVALDVYSAVHPLVG